MDAAEVARREEKCIFLFPIQSLPLVSKYKNSSLFDVVHVVLQKKVRKEFSLEGPEKPEYLYVGYQRLKILKYIRNRRRYINPLPMAQGLDSSITNSNVSRN